MRFCATVFLLLLTVPLWAQEDPPPEGTRDFSRGTLLRLFSEDEDPPSREGNVQWSFGAVEFKAAGMRWKIGYLPFMVPLPGSLMTTTGWNLPDPFLLTNTEFATMPRNFRDRREMNSEMKRIERLSKRATVKVEP